MLPMQVGTGLISRLKVRIPSALTISKGLGLVFTLLAPRYQQGGSAFFRSRNAEQLPSEALTEIAKPQSVMSSGMT